MKKKSTIALLALAALVAGCRTKSSVTASCRLAVTDSMQSTRFQLDVIGKHAESLVLVLDSVTIEAIPIDTVGLACVLGTTHRSGGAVPAPTTPFRLRARRIILSKSDSTFSHMVQDSAAARSVRTLEASRDTTSAQVQPAPAVRTCAKKVSFIMALALCAIAIFLIWKHRIFNVFNR